MCINEGDKVIITCSKKDAVVMGTYVKKCDDGHIIEIELKTKTITQYFSFDEWEVERCEHGRF